ncbi:MAG: protein kinase [Legionellaceae bacterium]|nr:protein kinase [Legionellaceae bacterium]
MKSIIKEIESRLTLGTNLMLSARAKALENNPEAISDFQQAIGLNPNLGESFTSDDWQFFYAMAKLHHAQHNYVDAIKFLSFVIHINPNFFSAYQDRYRCYRAQGEHQLANNDLKYINSHAIFRGASKDDLVVGDKIIGFGQFGEVANAFWKDIPAAIKKIKGREIDDALYEVRLQASLSHFNIVRVFTTSADRMNNIYLVMERMSFDLCDILMRDDQKSFLSLKTRISILKDVAKALQYLHGLGVIHKDIKPDNIMLDSQMNAKIGDFGLSHKIGDNRPFNISGTVGYSAPELHYNIHTLKIDYYSYGVLFLVTMIAALPGLPYSKNRMIGYIRKNIDNISFDLLSEFADIISKYTAKNPEEREPSLGKLVVKMGVFEQQCQPVNEKKSSKNLIVTGGVVKMEGCGLKLHSGPVNFWSNDEESKRLRSNIVPYQGCSPLLGA